MQVNYTLVDIILYSCLTLPLPKSHFFGHGVRGSGNGEEEEKVKYKYDSITFPARKYLVTVPRTKTKNRQNDKMENSQNRNFNYVIH